MAISISAVKRKDRNTVESSVFPDATNTGWARTGVTLSAYSGPQYWNNAGAVTIDSKSLTGGGLAVVGNTQLTVTRSLINTSIDVSYPASLTIEDCNVNGGNTSSPTIGYDNLTVRRCNVTGGQHSVMCGSYGLIEDNYLHDNYNDPDALDGYHNNSYISNGGQDVIVRHNTFKCDTTLTPSNNGGPSGDASIFGDFGALDNFLFDNNLFMPTTGAFGLSAGWNPGKTYGDNPTNIVVTNNVFMRGTSGINAAFGPVTSFKAAGTGNVWTNNRYDDGTLITP